MSMMQTRTFGPVKPSWLRAMSTPVIVNGMEDMSKQVASENEQSDKDLKDVEEKYLRN